MISPSDLLLAPEPDSERLPPMDDPLPDGAPVIDDPSREVPTADPRRPGAPQPARDPRPNPAVETQSH